MGPGWQYSYSGKQLMPAARRIRVRHQEGTARVPEELWPLMGQVGSPGTRILCLMKVGEDEIDQLASVRTEPQEGLVYEITPFQMDVWA